MLTQEDPNTGRETRHGEVTPKIAVGLTAMVLVVLFLRHDYWNWENAGPFFLGFLPVGLWWQGLVSLLACVMMAVMVRYAWPQHLEDEAENVQNADHDV